MSAPKHTAGPWFADQAGGDWVVGNDEGELIVFVAAEDVFDSATREANARLIAAAPDLLEAALDARRAVALDRDSLVECHTIKGDIATLDAIAEHALADYDATLAKLDAVIAKATGADQ